jgi:hypothetical protein
MSFLELLGKQADSREVEDALNQLGTLHRPKLGDEDEQERERHYDWVTVKRRGVEFGFADAAYFAALPQERWRTEGLSLVEICFYSDTRPEVRRYSGELPFRLSLADSQASTREKMSSFENTRRSYKTDFWQVEELEVVVDYLTDRSRIDSVMVELPIAAYPEAGRQQPPISVARWRELFGLPQRSSELQQTLSPLDLARRITTGDAEREVDFTFECGVELMFEEARALKSGVAKVNTGLVLGAVKFHRARDLESRQWTGALPFDLQFNDSPETLFNKIRTEPAKHEDGRLTGRGLWHFQDCSLNVLYSTIKNFIFRVTLMAPGYWSEMRASFS